MKKLILIVALASALFADTCLNAMRGTADYARKLKYSLEMNDFYMANSDYGMFKLYVKEGIIYCSPSEVESLKTLRDNVTIVFMQRYGNRVSK